MSRREEGSLSDPTAQQEGRKAEGKVRRVYREDLLTLEQSPAFRRWFGKWAASLVMLDFRTTNGSELQDFNGRRSLMLEMLREIDFEVPGFFERVLLTRRLLENELRAEPQNEE